MRSDIVRGEEVQDGGGCAPFIADMRMVREGVVAVKEGCQVFKEGSSRVVVKEVGVVVGDMCVPFLQPVEARKGKGPGQGAIRAVEEGSVRL